MKDMVPKKTGHPKKWETPEALQAQIDQYFEDIVEEVWVEVPVQKKGKGTDKPVEVMEWRPVMDRFGKVAKRYKVKPSITGLAVALGTNRETIMNYSKDSIFFDTVSRVKAIIESFYEMEDEAPHLKIFKLKNFGWRDVQEVKSDQVITQVNRNVDSVDLEDRIGNLIDDGVDIFS